MNNIKLCGWCGKLEPHGKNKSRKDGLANGCKKCRSAAQVKYHQEGPGKLRAKERRDKVKLEAFEAYGGCECVGCGETESVVLSIDHINGGGNKHRLAINKRRRVNEHLFLVT